MGRLGRILLVAFAVLAAALALVACGGGSSSDTTDGPGTTGAPEPETTTSTGEEDEGTGIESIASPALEEALAEAAESGVPVRVAPPLLEHPPGGATEPTVLRSPSDSYTLGISTDPKCHLKGECTAAIFSGFSSGGELTGEEVKLADGIGGVYEPGRCGPGCQFGTIEWIQDGHRYGLAVAKVPQAKLVAYANEAIEARPIG